MTMRSSYRSRAILLALLLFSSGAEATTERILKQVHVVTRHGSRLVLRKGDNLKEFTEGPLTALGQKQQYDLGVWIKRRYNHVNTSFFFDVYQQDKVRLESSSFERTVTSANSLALGLFNATARDPNDETLLLHSMIPANIPVYSRDVFDDYRIRAYDKCPDGLLLNELYQSLPFQILARKHATLLQELGNISQFSVYSNEVGDAVALDMIWNVFDSISVAKTECSGSLLGGSTCPKERQQLLNLLTNEQWDELQEVSKQTEFLKYGTKNAGRLIGGNLILQMLERMNQDVSTNKTLDGFYLYSAHYPVLLGLLAALEEDPVNKESIPAYAAALILELYLDTVTGEKYVHVVYRPGANEDGLTKVKSVVLDAVCPIDNDNSNPTAMCTLGDLNNFFADFSLEYWCQECGSPANACLPFKVSQATCDTTATDNTFSHFTGTVGFFVGLVVGLIGVASASFLWSRQTRRAEEGVATTKHIATSNDPEDEEADSVQTSFA